MKLARTRGAALLGALMTAAVVAPVGMEALHAQVRCYFKDCVVYPDGSRECKVIQIPCPTPS